MKSSATLDLEYEYAAPSMMEEYMQCLDGWTRDAAAYREAAGARAELDLAYGDKPRQRLDLFAPATQLAPASGSSGPVALFIHGGYWQITDKSIYSHMARGATENGVTVAVAGYTLCPETTLAGIVDEIRRAVAFVAKRLGKPVTVYGHSAGGHLTACMLATDWRSFDPSLPEDVVRAGLPISGVFELEPLLSTSVNRNVGLDAAEARRLSPLLWPAPKGKSMIAYVGGKESSEFLRQTRGIADRWGAEGVLASRVEVPGATHFSVIAPLADPASSITQDLVQLASAAPRLGG